MELFQICSLLRGGIAERGGVRVGHRIIEINGQSVVAVPHERIVNLLATSVGEVSNNNSDPTKLEHSSKSKLFPKCLTSSLSLFNNLHTSPPSKFYIKVSEDCLQPHAWNFVYAIKTIERKFVSVRTECWLACWLCLVSDPHEDHANLHVQTPHGAGDTSLHIMWADSLLCKNIQWKECKTKTAIEGSDYWHFSWWSYIIWKLHSPHLHKLTSGVLQRKQIVRSSCFVKFNTTPTNCKISRGKGW